MQGFKDWLVNNSATFKTIITIVLGFGGFIFAGICVWKAMSAFKDGNGKEGAKQVAFAVLIALVAIGGIAISYGLANKFGTDDTFLPQGDWTPQ